MVYKGITKVDILDKKTFEFDLIGNIDEAMSILKRHLNLSYEIKTKKRVEKLEIPEVVLREAIVNAVAHRDYFEKGATVMVEIFDDRVEISNPGGLPKGLKEEDFGKRTLARNPLIASLLHRAGYIEKLGTGVPRIKKGMMEAELPEPKFEFDKFFVITLKRTEITNAVFTRKLEGSEVQMKRFQYLLQQLHDKKMLDIAAAANKLNSNERTIRRDLAVLKEKGWVLFIGTTRNRIYRLSEEGFNRFSEIK